MNEIKDSIDDALGAGTTDKASGSFKQAGGTVKSRFGEATGDTGLEAEGVTDQAEGKLQRLEGEVKATLETVGEILSDVAKDAKASAEALIEKAKAKIAEHR
jgi:uncharacterized protein YjbJ (UPF0337 family)